jgi:hypothetical protein
LIKENAMNDTVPAWVARVRALDARAEALREGQADVADDRARIIYKAVRDYGRGGRDKAAGRLGASVRAIDEAIKRARTASAPAGLPYDLLERLYALELAELPPLPARLWQALAQILAGTFVDAAWVEQPGELIAQEVEDSDFPSDLGEEDEHETAALAETARSWTRIQALAVLDAITRRDLQTLPSTGEEVPVR